MGLGWGLGSGLGWGLGWGLGCGLGWTQLRPEPPARKALEAMGYVEGENLEAAPRPPFRGLGRGHFWVSLG